MAPGRPSCTEIVASAGQTKFECQTDFLEEHAGKQTFYAFVHAKLFGLPVPVPFEISEDATAVVNVGDPLLEFRFESDLEGWETGTTTDGWGTAQWRSWCGSGLPSGCVKLDGVGGDGVANAWIFKTFDLPASVTTLELETTAHNRDGADSEYRIRIVDAGGVETILADWTASSGAEDQYFWDALSYDISSFAGQQVTVYLEGGDNGPGTHEQRYYDNVVIR